VPSPWPKRVALALTGVLLAGALAASFFARAGTGTSAPLSHSRVLAADAEAPLRPRALQQAPIAYRGGPITTSTGEVVDVRVSDSLPVETSTPEGWAEFLTRLTHGPELARLTTFIVTFEEVQQICGSQAAGCYGPNRMVVPGETAFEITPEEIVRHEYGHHVAFHRANTPWAAIDWGPKRWASAANVCARVARREVFPGNEGSNYPLNPGEAWAEAYRLMDERKAGIATATWPIVDASFFPSDAALRAAEQDVLQPWGSGRTVAHSRAFGEGSAKVWWVPVATPLDGDYRLTVTVPNGGTHDVALVASNRRTVVGRAQWVGQRVKRLAGSICGQRSLFVRVTQKGALGRVRVSLSTP
jgi:hypothetical protein